MSWPPIPAHGFGIPRLPPPAPLYVDLDERATLTMRVGPKGKTLTTTVKELIKFAAARCGRY